MINQQKHWFPISSVRAFNKEGFPVSYYDLTKFKNDDMICVSDDLFVFNKPFKNLLEIIIALKNIKFIFHYNNQIFYTTLGEIAEDVNNKVSLMQAQEASQINIDGKEALLQASNNEIFYTSLDVAKVFEKEHTDILRVNKLRFIHSGD